MNDNLSRSEAYAIAGEARRKIFEEQERRKPTKEQVDAIVDEAFNKALGKIRVSAEKGIIVERFSADSGFFFETPYSRVYKNWEWWQIFVARLEERGFVVSRFMTKEFWISWDEKEN